ncbi:MAG: dipeptide epimerase, partial [Bacteroidetes bacterium]
MHHYISLFDRVLKKRFPLAISRGVRYDSTNVFIQITEGSFSGIGEAAPGTSEGAGTPEEVRQELNRFLETNPESLSVYQAFDRAREMKVAPSAYA